LGKLHDLGFLCTLVPPIGTNWLNTYDHYSHQCL
jgi:hypothetical protein